VSILLQKSNDIFVINNMEMSEKKNNKKKKENEEETETTMKEEKVGGGAKGGRCNNVYGNEHGCNDCNGGSGDR